MPAVQSIYVFHDKILFKLNTEHSLLKVIIYCTFLCMQFLTYILTVLHKQYMSPKLISSSSADLAISNKTQTSIVSHYKVTQQV